jgi:hypothetical protein
MSSGSRDNSNTNDSNANDSNDTTHKEKTNNELLCKNKLLEKRIELLEYYNYELLKKITSQNNIISENNRINGFIDLLCDLYKFNKHNN